jgi:hypothetical protein
VNLQCRFPAADFAALTSLTYLDLTYNPNITVGPRQPACHVAGRRSTCILLPGEHALCSRPGAKCNSLHRPLTVHSCLQGPVTDVFAALANATNLRTLKLGNGLMGPLVPHGAGNDSALCKIVHNGLNTIYTTSIPNQGPLPACLFDAGSHMTVLAMGAPARTCCAYHPCALLPRGIQTCACLPSCLACRACEEADTMPLTLLCAQGTATLQAASRTSLPAQSCARCRCTTIS